MHHFAYRNGVLHAEDVDLRELADAVGTPFYCYATATLERHYRRLRGSLRRRRRAHLLRDESQFQSGRDRHAGAARRRRRRGLRGRAAAARGRPAFRRKRSSSPASARPSASWRLPSSKAFSASTSNRSRSWNFSPPSAAQKSRAADIAIRVNPDVDAKTHAKIATGKAENKFGIPISRAREVYARAAKLPGVRVTGVDMHIGCQITELEPFDDAFALLADFVRALRADGHAIRHVDLGGGLGIPYREDNEPPPDPSAYAAVVKRAHARPRLPAHFRAGPPDRRQCRHPRHSRPLSSSTARPRLSSSSMRHERSGAADALRRAPRDLRPVNEAPVGAPRLIADVVGPVCETGDFIALTGR